MKKNTRWVWKRLSWTAALLSGTLSGSAMVWADGIIQFSPANYSVNESNIAVSVTVTRTGATLPNIAWVFWGTTNGGTATPNVDYCAGGGQQLTWYNGENSSKTFNIPITDDLLPEGNETFYLILYNVVGASLGNTSAIVTIVDNDPWAPPATPTGLNASDGEYADKIRVSWNPPATNNVVAYTVWRSTASNSATATQIGTCVPSGVFPVYAYEDLTAGTGVIYYYWVKATNNAGSSAFSAGDSGYLLAPPPAPTGVNASDGTYTNMVWVSWNAVPNANSYTVWRNTINNSVTAAQIGISGIGAFPQYNDLMANAGVTYYYWVKAMNNAGSSAFSAGNSGFRGPPTALPSAPTGVSASDGTYLKKVRVNWNTATGCVAGYTIWRSTVNNSSSATQIGTSDTTIYDDPTAAVNVTYYYWVKAMNSLGSSGFSAGDSGFRTRVSSGQSLTPSSSDETDTNIEPYVIINGQVYGQAPGDTTALQANAETSDTLKVAVYLRIAEEISTAVMDWWILGRVNDAFYIYADGDWKTLEESAVPTYQGTAFSMLTPYIVLDQPIESLPSGIYTFFFGWDTHADGMLNTDKLVGAIGEVLIP